MTDRDMAQDNPWNQDPALEWLPVTSAMVLCPGPHDAAVCVPGEPSAVVIGAPRAGFEHLCGLEALLAVLLPVVERDAPDVLSRHAAILGLLTGTAGDGPDDVGRRFVPVSEAASLGTTRRVSRESHTTALWIDRAARFLADAVAAAVPGGGTILDLAAFEDWDRVSVRILYRSVLVAHTHGTPFLVRGALRDGSNDFLPVFAAQRGVRVCGELPPVSAPVPSRLAVPAWGQNEATGALRSIGDAIALQNFERADLLIAAHLRVVDDPDGKADLIRLQAISAAQTGRIDEAVAKLETSLTIAVRPELRAHLNYLIALLTTKRKDDTAVAREYYRRGLAVVESLAEPSEEALVEKAWILNGIALAAALEARGTDDPGEREQLFHEAYEREFTAFRLVRGIAGDSAFYLRYNLSHNLAFLLQITDRHAEAESFLKSVSVAMLNTGRPDFLVLHKYAIGVLQLRGGDHVQASATFDEALSVAHSLRDPFYLEKMLAAAGYTALRAGDHEAAARRYREGARVSRWLCDEDAYAQNLAGLLWSLALSESVWSEQERAAARHWYPSVSRAYEDGAERAELSGVLTSAGAEVAPPSSKLPSYLPAVDLEGTPGRDLNRFLAGITARENPGHLADPAAAVAATVGGVR